MAIWTRPISIEALAESHKGTAPEHLGMEFLEIADEVLSLIHI